MDVVHSPQRLWTPAFALIWAMTFLTFFAAFQLFPTVPLRLRDLGVSLADSGRFLTFFTLGSSVGALFTGPLGDRIGHRRLLRYGTVGFGMCLFLQGLFVSRWGFYLLAFPHGVVWSGVLTGTMATLGSVLPDTQRADGMALYGLASPTGVIVGPLMGLWMFDHVGFRTLVWVLAGIFLVLGWLAGELPSGEQRAEHHDAFRLPDAKAGEPVPKPPRAATTSGGGFGTGSLGPCAVLFGLALGYGALSTYTAQEGKGLHFAVPSVFLSTLGVGMVAMRLIMARHGFGVRPIRLLPRMHLLAFAGLLILAVFPGGLSRHLLSALVYGAGYSMVFTLLNARLLEVVDPQRRGAAFGALLFAFDAGIGLGAFALGKVIGLAGYRWGWALGALCILLVLPVAWRMARDPAVVQPGI